ncbi:MAG: DUF2490 domain-containing protein [Candidatus Omnitrophica bacterium]|nr:DUF2490 domain-containing protein [Candidatus Omnitrophota bacterium]
MPAVAGEVWSWHTVDVSVVKTSRAEVILHGRLRTGNSFGTPQQGRVGVISKLPFPSIGSLVGGYYYGKEEDSSDEWQNKHRIFGGLEVPVYGGHGVAIDTRGLVERFFVPDSPAFNRYRQRFRLRTDGRLGPYLSTEWFFDANGYLSSRHGAGLRWRCAESVTLEFGYLYDARRANIGEPRHVIVTQFTLDRLWR